MAAHGASARQPGATAASWRDCARLKRRPDYVRVQASPCRCRGRYLSLMVLAAPSGTYPSRLGLTVSRKVGNAVVRNRVRRRLRAIGRALAHQLVVAADHVIVAHPSAAEASFDGLCQELSWLLVRAHRRLVPSPPAASPSSSSTA